jgi:hypothetical protein
MREVVKRRALMRELSTTLAVSKQGCHCATLSTATRPRASLLCNFLLISRRSFLSLVPFRCPRPPCRPERTWLSSPSSQTEQLSRPCRSACARSGRARFVFRGSAAPGAVTPIPGESLRRRRTMRRRSRTATWIVAGVMLLSTTLSPRPSGAYRVPLETPPSKGDPDEPYGYARSTQPSAVERQLVIPVIITVQIAPGFSMQLVIRIPIQRQPAVWSSR